MAEVRFEAHSWLARKLGGRDSRPLRSREAIGEGETLRDLLRRMGERDPRFAALVFDPELGQLSEHAHLILNGRVFELAGGLDAPLHDGDEVLLLPAFTGGLGTPGSSRGKTR